jgi:hypothetical protein
MKSAGKSEMPYGESLAKANSTLKTGIVYTSELGWDLVLLGVESGMPLIFLRLKDMLMFDWDSIDEATCRGQLLDLVSRINRGALFDLYRTANGFHGFLISEACSPRRKRSIEWSRIVKSDPKYLWMSVARGHYDVRLSPKHQNDIINEHVDRIGSAKANDRLTKVILAHDLITKWTQDISNTDWKTQSIDWFEMLTNVCEGIDEATNADD